jgi:hypothetical protein
MPNCHVFVDGNRLAIDDEARLVSVDVDLDGELFGRCEVSFHDPSLKLIDGREFQSGTAVQIDLGFGSQLSRIFDGEVVCLEPRFRRDVPPSLHVICYERLHRLALSPATRAFNNVDDDEIVKNIARDHGLTGEAPTGSKSHILQSNVTDAVLLRRIAQKDGNRIKLDGKKIVVAAPATGAQVVIAPGDGLKKVKVRINALSQVEEVTVHGWDPQARQEIVGKAKAQGGQRDEGAKKYGAGKTLSFAGHEHAPTDTATADRMARGRLQKIADGFVTAEMELIGDPRLRPEVQVELQKAGAQIDGIYRVDRARHRFSKHGYLVSLKAVRISTPQPAAQAQQAPPPQQAQPAPAGPPPAALSAPAAQKAPQPAAKAKVDPVIKPAKLNVVVKKLSKDSAGTTKPYTKPKRQKLVLSTSESFEAPGTGTFTRSNDSIKFFKSADKDDEIKFDGKDNVFKGPALSSGVTLYAEGAKPSAALDDIKLTLKLAGGSKTIGLDAVATATSVEVTLDICKGRPSAGGDPPPLAQDDKIAVGRNLLVQDAAGHFERAQIIIQQVKPAAFAGSLVVSAKGGVTAFTNEKPTKGEKEALPYTIADASKISPKGDRTLWAEGKVPSKDMLDAGFILALKGLEDDADHVVATAVQIQLDICQSRKKAKVDPDAMSAEKKLKVGRFVHEQDTGGHHGRALLVVRKVNPEKFKGTLVLNGKNAAKIEVFPNELKTGGETAIALPLEIGLDPKDATKKNEEKKFWVQGKTASAALREVSLWLQLKDDNTTNADTVLMTVVKFKKLTADIPCTPAVTNRAGNSPVNRHAWKIADPTPGANDFNEDYAANKPIVLLENSILDGDRINLSVAIEPAGVPVRWAVIRDRRPAPDGDHKDVIGLAGNREAPTLGSDAEGLSNTLVADAVGSFHICPFVNCNEGKTFEFMAKDGTRIDREPFIMMNLVLVRVQGISNDSKGQKANCSPRPAAGQTAANFSGFTTSSSGGAAWTAATSGWHADAKVDVIGGGQDGRLGLDKVFGGWIQHIFLNNIRADYNLPAPPPPAPPPAARSHRYAFISNLPDNVHYGQYHYIGAAEAALSPPDAALVVKTAPVIDASSILDVSPFGGEGTGGDSAVGSNGFQGGTTGSHGGGYPAPTARPIGQRWQREMWDAPAIGCRRRHISAGGMLAHFRFNLGFRTDLCFWTNTDAVPDPTANGVANRVYVSVYRCTWTPDFEIGFHPVTGVGSITTAAQVTVTKDKSAPNGRAVAVDGLGLETRSPFALAWYAVDART